MLNKKSWVSVNKIVIFGSPGSGKTELASQLGDKLGISKNNIFFLDQEFWTKDWQPTEDRLDRLEKMFFYDHWIIEGNFSQTFNRLLHEADCIIHLQISKYVCLRRIAKKWIGYISQFHVPIIDEKSGRRDRIRLKYIKDIWLYPQIEGKALTKQIKISNKLSFSFSTTQDISFFLDNASNWKGTIALQRYEKTTAQEAFLRTIGQADEILSKTAEYYSALDAKGLAICGLILAGRGDPSMPTEANDGKTVLPDKSTISAGRVAPTLDDAIEIFRKARKIAPHVGVVKATLRLFDELMKCEGGEILKDVRNAVEGK